MRFIIIAIVALIALSGCSGDVAPIVPATPSESAATLTQVAEDMRIEPTAPPIGEVDCFDFALQSEAQAFFIAEGGPASDPYGLDADDDGQACEDNY